VGAAAAIVALRALWRAPAVLRDLDTAATPPADWRFPRLGFPAPPPFEASADPDQLRIRWNGEDAVVRTTVVGGGAVERAPAPQPGAGESGAGGATR